MYLGCSPNPDKDVTPFAGVWIEMVCPLSTIARSLVTPFAGVWIEISIRSCLSFASRVTPFAGVWIEMSTTSTMQPQHSRHPLRGGVD